MRSPLSRSSLIISLISVVSIAILPMYAVTYPALPNPGGSEVTGGYFNTYFTNIFSNICFSNEIISWFTSTGVQICSTLPVTPVSNTTLSLSGSLVGTPNYIAKYTPTGTGINNSQVFDDGTNVGVGTASPGARLEVAWQVKITGGVPGINRVLTSDATGLAYWSSAIVGATATGITWGTQNYIPKFGTWGIGLYLSQFFDDGNNIGIGTVSPWAKLDIAGTIRITGGGIGSGKVLTSDATGLASWQPSVSTADFALSGAFWRQSGNSGTTSATDYVGTADNMDLVFRRNLVEGMRLSGASSTLITLWDARVNGITVGRWAGNVATNTANGYQALYSNITGYQNSAVGMSSLYSTSVWYNNTALWYLAGANLTSGNNNIFIGYNTQPNISDTLSNQINIGNVIYGYNGNIGIGITNPLARLDIWGNIKIADGTEGTGKVLTSDIAGIATWQTPAAAPSTTTLGLAGPLVGTTNYIAKYTPTGTGINNSQLYDTGTGVGLGTTTPGARLDIVGSVRIGWVGASLDYRPNNIPCSAGQILAWSGTLSNWICSNDSIGISGSWLLANYVTKWNGSIMANSQLFDTGTGVGIGTSTPGARLEVAGQVKITGGVPWAGKVLTSDATGLATWSSSLSGATATGIIWGTQNYISKFGTGWNGLYPSQVFDTGTGVGIGTLSPTALLDINGQLRLRTGSSSGYYLVSDALGVASWTSPIATGLSISGSVLGSTLYYNGITWVPSTNIYNSGSNIGIGTATPSAKLSVSGSALITGDITVQGKVITDTIVNRSVANISISGSLLPDAAAPVMYRDIGSSSLPWQNLYLSNQITIAGWSPGLGKILTSDATGLATWSSSLSGATATGITGWVQNYVTKFGTGGTGLYPSQVFDTGTGVGIGTVSPTALLDVNGQIRLRTGAAVWRYLVSDALGVASWTTAVTATAFSVTGSVLGSTLYYDGTSWIPSTNIYNSGGNVGIGTTTPSKKLDVSGDILVNGITVGKGSGSLATNTVLGATALVNTTGTNNTAIGYISLNANTSGYYNTANGANTLSLNTLGWYNTANGVTALFQNTTGNFNTANGVGALSQNSTGSDNTAFGYRALEASKANNNTALGDSAGANITTGGSNIAIGYNAQVVSNTASNQLSIGNWIYGDNGNIGIGTATPSAKLEINGQIKITGGSPSAGEILTSDATGLATWSSSISGATATGITWWVANYVSKFGTGWNGLYASQIFDNGTNIGVGTGVSLTTKFVIDSGIANDSGLKFSRINLSTPLTSNNVLALGIDGSGKVLPISPISNIAVYTGTLRSSPPTPNPDLNTFNVSYDFNQYFAIPGKQSFVVSKWDGPSNNGPYFKENGTDALCSITGTYGSPGAYDCADPDPVTGISASPYNSFTMSAKGDTFGYQLALGARGDAPLFARSGRFNGNQTGWLYTNDSPYQTPAPWQRVLSIPANHSEYLYINTGLNSQLQAITGGGQIGIGTSFPDRHFVVAGSAVGSTSSAVPQMIIKRWVQWADANLGVAYGTPYLNIWWLENRLTALQTIGFGYSGLAGTTRYAPAEIGFITTSTTGNTQGDIVFANRSTTTNVAPVEVVRITSTGAVGIGTQTPTSRLDIAGTFELGTNGSQLNAFIKAAPTVDIASIAASACLAQTFTVTNAVVGWVAAISPTSALTDRMVIAYARVSAANTVEAKFCNESVSAIDLPSMVYNISVIQ